MHLMVVSVSCARHVRTCREAWGERLAQLKQQELQEITDARHKAQEVRGWMFDVTYRLTGLAIGHYR